MASSIHLIHGTDELRVSDKAREIARSLYPEGEEADCLEVVDGVCANEEQVTACLRRVVEGLRTVSMFNPRRVVWLRGQNFLPEKKAGESEESKAQILKFEQEISKPLGPEVFLVISGLDVSKRSTFYKALAKVADIHFFELPKQGREADKAAVDMVRGLLTEAGVSAPGDAVAAFVERSGVDPRQLRTEVGKMLLYLDERKNMTIADVHLMVSPTRELTGWELADLAGARDLASAVRMVDLLVEQKVSEVQMIMGLSGRFRDLSLFRGALDSGAAQLSGSANYMKLVWRTPEAETGFFAAAGKEKVHPYRQMLIAQQAQKFSAAELARARKWIAEAHDRLFRSGLPAGLQIQLLLTKLLQKAA
ncbi:MAG: hypothetical protein U1F87_17225 [Kiritimatiellia bacterium]